MAYAIEIAGTQANLAEWVGYKQQGISNALLSGRVSPQLAIRIEQVTKGRIKALALCPTLLG